MQSVKPKVSVCIVTYNHVKYVAECLQSVLEQSVPFSFEVIVGDDCSTDGASEIIDEFARRNPHIIRVVRHKKNVGPTENYLRVHSLAEGEYVCHCDGDDFWLQGKLQKQVAYMDRNPDVVQCWHRQHVVDSASRKIGVFPKRFPQPVLGRPMTINDLALSYGLVGQHSSQMYRRLAKTVHYRDRPTIDYFFALDIAAHGLSVNLPNFWGCYRVVEGGSVTQAAHGRDVVDVCVVEAVDYFAKSYPDTKPEFKANIYVRALGAAIKKRRNWRGMINSVKAFPISISSMIRSLLIFACHRF